MLNFNKSDILVLLNKKGFVIEIYEKNGTQLVRSVNKNNNKFQELYYSLEYSHSEIINDTIEKLLKFSNYKLKLCLDIE